MLTSVVISFFLIAGPAACLGAVLWRTARYADRVRKSTHQYTAVSIVGWLAGMIGAVFGVGVVVDALEQRGLIPVAWFSVPVAYLAVLAGAAVGASAGYFWLRLAAKKDPDYDEAPAATSPGRGPTGSDGRSDSP